MEKDSRPRHAGNVSLAGVLALVLAGCGGDSIRVHDAGMRKLGVRAPRALPDSGAGQRSTRGSDAAVLTTIVDAAVNDARANEMDASRDAQATKPFEAGASQSAVDAALHSTSDAATASADAHVLASDGGSALLDAGAMVPPPPPPAVSVYPPLPFDNESDDDAGTRPPPPNCVGKRGAPGTNTRMYMDRQYIVHIPTIVDPNTAVPVLFAVHGAGGTGDQMQQGTQFDVIADVEGFVTIYPNGASGNSPWNVGVGACLPGGVVTNNNDDFTYFEQMLDDVEQDQCVDRGAVFVAGFSMGGYFAHHIGCQLGNRFTRAVAPHSGGTYAGSCPGAPLPVLIVHGDADPLINLSCAQTARDLWVERNGCASDYDTFDLTGGTCEWNRACPEHGQVALCIFHNLQHAWAYPPDYTHSSLLIWAFFKHYL